MGKTISRLLIANRGEIARRIIRTAHDAGYATVAVYADADRNEPFVREADQAIALRGETAAATYLDQSKLLDAARATDADAIHPGYGFLAENASFCHAVLAAGLTWVGPGPQAIESMGDKLSSKRLMSEAGVPNLPSAELKPGEDAAQAAADIGFPVLVKASAGGGGKGMRVVLEAGELEAAISSARREARAAFGDDTLFLERWLSGARHIEIQVLGDTHGNVVHCFERECSIQRRHQKIIEEAPSPAVDETLRQRMGEAAVAAARAIDYVSTGTVEFLVQDGEFWFLEMNTRLQVEHPVTEAITGLDLVHEQLRIAEGEPLGYGQGDLGITGHSIEARLYAEDPGNDFLPTTGEVVDWTPSTSSNVRFDSGIETGSVIGIDFDPLLAKVIVHARSRREATMKLARALETTRLQGLTTNRDFLVTTLRTREFLSGETTTDFIERVAPEPRLKLSESAIVDACVAVALAKQCDNRAKSQVLVSVPSGWRNTPMPPQRVMLRRDSQDYLVDYRLNRDGQFDCTVGESQRSVEVIARTARGIELEIDNRRLNCSVVKQADSWWVNFPGADMCFVELPRFATLGAGPIQGGLNAPMPGKVVSTHVTSGEAVSTGQLLLIIEAMKMEHRITAPLAGLVDDLCVKAGQQVANGELLAVIAPSKAPEQQ